MDNTAPSETTAPDRRRFLRALGAGGALSAIAVAARASSASAQATATTVPSTTASTASTAVATTTTIAAPKAPTTDDLPLLRFAMQLELVAVAAYDAALGRVDGGTLKLDDTLAPVVRVFRQHHAAYAQALSGLIGKTAPSGPIDALVKKYGTPFQNGAVADVLKAATDLENIAVATHLSLLQKVASIGGATLIASILTVEARHAAVLGSASGSKDLIPSSGIDSLSLALDPSAYATQ